MKIHEKKRLKKVFLFDPHACRGAEEFLEKMAGKGWRLVEVVNNSYYFEAMEPEKLRYAVKVFDGASNFDLTPSGNTMNYVEYCEAAGWKFIASVGKIHYFCEEESGAEEIETDARLERKAVVRATWSRCWHMWTIFPMLIVGMIYNLFHGSVFGNFTNYPMILAVLTMVLVLLISIEKFISFHIWWVQKIRQERMGRKFTYLGLKSVYLDQIFWIGLMVWIMIIYLVVGIIAHELLCIVVVVLAVTLLVGACALNRILRKQKTDAKSNIIISVAVGLGVGVLMIYGTLFGYIYYFWQTDDGEDVTVKNVWGEEYTYTLYEEELPIYMEDLGMAGVGYRNSDKEVDSTIFAGRYDYYDEFVTETDDWMGIYYSVYVSEHDWILENVEKQYVNGSEEVKEAEMEAWGCKKLVKKVDENGEWILVCYEDAILEWEADIVLQEEQIVLIRNKLHEEIPQIPAAE